MANKNFDQLADQINQRAATLSETASQNSNEKVVVEKGDATQSVAAASGATGASISVGNSVTASAATKKAVDAYAKESAEVRGIIDRLEMYSINMGKGKRILPAQIIQNQTDFVRTLEQLVNLSSNGDFAVCFRRLLTLVNENKTGAFGIDLIHRKISSISKSDTYVVNYTAFIDMVLAFSDGKNRPLFIRRYNLNASVQFIKSQYRERCIEFIRAISGQ